MPDPLSLAQVKHVAKLSRLRLSEEQLAAYRHQLAAVLDHIAMLSKVDVEGVEPMAHPTEITNRLDDDRVGPMLTVAQALANAPAVENSYIAVPKVLGEGGGA